MLWQINPADGASRDGLADLWTLQMSQRFKWAMTTCWLPSPDPLVNLPFKALTESILRIIQEFTV